MKTPIALALALLCVALAPAADIALRDGRILRNAAVLKQDASTVTFRHAGGFSQVEKSKLPDELAAQYPIDEAAAARQRAENLNRLRNAEQEAIERRAKASNEAAVRSLAESSSPEAKRRREIRNVIGSFIQRRYGRFRTTGTKGWVYSMPEFVLSDPVPVPEAVDQWTVDGVLTYKDDRPAEQVVATIKLHEKTLMVTAFKSR